MLIQKKAPCDVAHADRRPQGRCARRWVSVLAITAGMITGANAQVTDVPPTTDQVLKEAREQLAILKALREEREQRLQEAEQRQPKIIAASALEAKPATQIDFHISIISADLAPPESVLEIRGLPPLVTLSAGKALRDRSWALPLDALSNLKMQVPADASGRLELELVIISNDQVVAFASSELIIDPGFVANDSRAQAEEGAPSEPRRDETVSALAAVAQPQSVTDGIRQEAAFSNDKKPEAGHANEARSDETARERRVDAAEAPRSDPGADTQPKRHNGLHETTAAITEARPRIAVGEAQPKQEATQTQPQIVAAASARATSEAHKTGEQAQQGLRANSDRAASLTPTVRSEPAANLAPPAADTARAQAERFATNGDRYLAHGNIAIARQYYLRAADLGLASAAVKIAITYDPHEMAQLGVVGMTANPEEARRWYQRAALLGAVEADARLRRLEAR